MFAKLYSCHFICVCFNYLNFFQGEVLNKNLYLLLSPFNDYNHHQNV